MRDQAATFCDALVAAAPRLLVSARRLTRNEDDAHDLLQETLARALRHRDRFAVGTNLGAWLRVMLRNQYLSQVRHEHAWQRVAGRLALDAASPPAQEHAVLLKDVGAALRRLSPPLAEALVMVRAEGRSCAEVAGVQNCHVGTVKSRLHRARGMLRDALEPRPHGHTRIVLAASASSQEAASCRPK